MFREQSQEHPVDVERGSVHVVDDRDTVPDDAVNDVFRGQTEWVEAVDTLSSLLSVH